MTVTTTPITPELYEYLRPLFWPEDDVLVELTADLQVRGPMIQIAPEQGALLGLLVALTRSRSVLEIGTLFGYSAIWMARALPASGRLDTIELSDVHADAAQSWFERAGVADRITVHRGAALDVLARLPGPYDLVFIDAVKSEYPAYLDLVLERVKPGSLIVVDNTLWRGRVADPAVDDSDVAGVREFNSRVATHPGLRSTLIPVGDGLTVSLVDGDRTESR